MKNALTRSLLGLGIAAATLMAGCNSGSSSGNPSNYPNCTAPGSFSAVYPVNGSTSAPASVQTIYVASSVALGVQFQSVVGAPNGSLYQGSGFNQVTLAQIPKPRTLPSFANPIYYSTYVGPLAPSSTWTFYLNNTNSANCVPVQFMQFTTL